MQTPTTSPAKQWEQICLTIVTLASATLGATIALADLPELVKENSNTTVAKAIMVAAASAIYVILAAVSMPVVFSRPSPTDPERNKERVLSIGIYVAFIIIVILLVGVLSTDMIADVLLPFHQTEIFMTIHGMWRSPTTTPNWNWKHTRRPFSESVSLRYAKCKAMPTSLDLEFLEQIEDQVTSPPETGYPEEVKSSGSGTTDRQTSRATTPSS